MRGFKFSLSSMLVWLFVGATTFGLTFNMPRQANTAQIVHDAANTPFFSEHATHVGFGFPFENRAQDYVIVDPSELQYGWVESASPWNIAYNVIFYFGFVAVAPFFYVKYSRWARENDPAFQFETGAPDEKTNLNAETQRR